MIEVRDIITLKCILQENIIYVGNVILKNHENYNLREAYDRLNYKCYYNRNDFVVIYDENSLH